VGGGPGEAAGVGGEVEVDAGGAVESGGVAVDGDAGGVDGGAEGGNFAGVVEPGGVPGVGVLGGEAEEAVAVGADHDGRTGGAGTAGAEFAIGDGVVLAFEIGLAGAEEVVDDAEAFFEATGAVVEGVAVGGELRFGPTGADGENETAVADLVDGVGDLARRAGLRKAMHETRGPISTLEVVAARAARRDQHSQRP
jgi:hypothetical protein